MSGTAEPVRPPNTDAEWARDADNRLKSLENPTSQRIGPWVLSASSEGHLIASYVDGGSVIIARKPETGENDPDAITDNLAPSVSVLRSALQSIPANGSNVRFDGTRLEVGGDWTGGRNLMDTVAVPVSGVYVATGTVQFENGSAFLTAAIMVDGKTRVAGRVVDSSGGPWMSTTATGILQLTAGQSVGLFAHAGVVRNVGAATLYGTPVPTELSLALIERRS
ncbi:MULTISPECIES: hypothetical protein [Nocardia]|uniref:hypothetical protein n=1 Tax=Nocardia TaxID=1817 RepID=UPI002455029F|nr:MULTISPECIES: hypothetical protein [Nocardia]